MHRYMLIILFAIVTTVWAQDDATDEDAAEPVPEAADEVEEDEFYDFELDEIEDHTEEDDDIFRPTDVISVQQSVPFPVDI
jgi:hypothetical protein